MFQRITPLFDKAGTEGGAGGGGETPAFTEAQEAALGKMLNAAITSHTKRQKPIAEELKSLDWGTMLKPHLDAYVAALPDDEGGTGGGDDEEPTGGKGKGGKSRQAGTDPAVAKQLSDLADKLEKSEAKARAAEEARTAAETQRSMDRATGELRNLLQPKVRPELLDFLVENMSVAKKQLKVGENGSAVLTIKRAPYKGAPEQDEDVPLSEAVPHWLASEGAKVFLPAHNANTPPPKGGRAPNYTPPAGGGELPADPAARTLAMFTAAGIDPSELTD